MRARLAQVCFVVVGALACCCERYEVVPTQEDGDAGKQQGGASGGEAGSADGGGSGEGGLKSVCGVDYFSKSCHTDQQCAGFWSDSGNATCTGLDGGPESYLVPCCRPSCLLCSFYYATSTSSNVCGDCARWTSCNPS